MSTWTDIRDWILGAAHGVYELAMTPFNIAGDALSRTLGPSLRGIGENFGQNIGKNFPTVFRIEGLDDIQVTFKFPDVITAASIIRDGLLNFSILGPSVQDLLTSQARVRRIEGQLRELHGVVTGRPRAGYDDFVFSVALLNSSMERLNPELTVPGILVREPCAARVTISLNGTLLAHNLELRIPAVARSAEPVEVVHDLLATTLKTNGENLMAFNVDPTTDSTSRELLGRCRLRIRLLRRGADASSTLVEWLFDGSSSASSCSASVSVGDMQWNPAPLASQKADTLANQIESLIKELAQPPAIKGEGPAAIATALALGGWRKSESIEALRQTLQSINDGDPNTIDLRTPLMATVSADRGTVKVNVVCVDCATGAVRRPIADVVLRAGDRIAVQLPFLAGRAVPNRSRSLHGVKFSVQGIDPGQCTVAVLAGFEWQRRTISARTIDTHAGDPDEHDVTIVLADALADQPAQ